jgi:lipase
MSLTRSLHVPRAAGSTPWFFLHAAGAGGAAFRGIARRLAGEITLHTPDLWPAAALPREGALFERDLHALLQKLVDHQGAILVGHGYGGALALEVARRRPDLVAELVLIEPLALQLLRDEQPDVQQLHTLIARLRELCEQGAHLEAARLFASYWDESSWAKLPELGRRELAESMPAVSRTLVELKQLEAGFDDYASIAVKTTLVRGARSPGPLRWLTAQLVRSLPRATLFEIAGAGHTSPTSHPAELAFLLRRHVLHGDYGFDEQ